MKKRVVAVVDDLFFAAKIRATAELLAMPIAFARDADALIVSAGQEPPALIIFDLQAQRIDPFALAARLKADESLRAIPLVGFFSHVQAELQQRARQAGFDRVMARSLFVKELPELLTAANQEPFSRE
jgi:CheY-like chemotaxis protein